VNSNKRNNISGVANPAVFKNESRVMSETNYTLIWEVDSYSPIIEYNLLFRRYSVSKARIWYTFTGIFSFLCVHGLCHHSSTRQTQLQQADEYATFCVTKKVC